MTNVKTKEYILATSGDRIEDTPGFQIRSIRVDNITDIWLTFKIGAQQRRVPPLCVNFTTPINGQHIEALLENTGGLTGGAGASTVNCTVTVASDRHLVAGTAGTIIP